MAKLKLAGFQSLKSELDNLMVVFLETVEQMRDKIKSNVRSDANPDGFLL